MRFEVFKRDSFKCQYCGASSPDVILHCDHIKPVKEGGKNTMLNLTTSCSNCNLGKGARTLDDTSVVVKQRSELEDLQAKREQIELMIKWQEGLSDLSSLESESIFDYYEELVPGRTLTPSGKHDLKNLVRKHGYQEVRKCMEISAGQYLEFDNDTGKVCPVSSAKTVTMISAIAENRKRYRNPDDSGLEFYASKVLGNLKYLSWSTKQYIHQLAKGAYDKGVDAESIRSAARNSPSLEKFYESIDSLLMDL
jgi:hypothetical protein